jgi:3alpha(or 20beta)-hydroxysteroid dehydrogenase
MADEGAAVVVADLNTNRARDVAGTIGLVARAISLDVTSADSWQQAVRDIEATEGHLDILFNNAGYFSVGRIETIDLDDVQRCIAVNQIGPILGLKTTLPLLRQSSVASVINMSSGSGMAGFAAQTAYASTKWAVRGISRCAAAEFADDGIRVNSVHPGPVNTPMINGGVEGVDQGQLHANLPIPRWADPMEIARLVVFLGSDDSSYCTGAEFVIDGGMLIGPRL